MRGKPRINYVCLIIHIENKSWKIACQSLPTWFHIMEKIIGLFTNSSKKNLKGYGLGVLDYKKPWVISHHLNLTLLQSGAETENGLRKKRLFVWVNNFHKLISFVRKRSTGTIKRTLELMAHQCASQIMVNSSLQHSIFKRMSYWINGMFLTFK